jgi:hypothetical protein
MTDVDDKPPDWLMPPVLAPPVVATADAPPERMLDVVPLLPPTVDTPPVVGFVLQLPPEPSVFVGV